MKEQIENMLQNMPQNTPIERLDYAVMQSNYDNVKDLIILTGNFQRIILNVEKARRDKSVQKYDLVNALVLLNYFISLKSIRETKLFHKDLTEKNNYMINFLKENYDLPGLDNEYINYLNEQGNENS